jgi:hypothetical protein
MSRKLTYPLAALAGAAMVALSMNSASAFTLAAPSLEQPFAAAQIDKVWWHHGWGGGWGWHHGWGGGWGWHRPWGWGGGPYYGGYYGGGWGGHCWRGYWGHLHCW